LTILQISVRLIRGAPPPQPLQVLFDSSGGTIGRADTNTLALDDPERTVSRVHAQVVCRDGRYFIIDRGSNPLLCNGRALGAGNEAPLGDGDRLTIGSFELTVRMLADAPLVSVGGPAPAASSMTATFSAHDDPFADLLVGLGPPSAPSVAPEPIPLPAGAPDPFADLLAPSPAPAALFDPPPASGQGAFDDFSDLAMPTGQGTPGIDSLFGGGGGLGGDPLALSPLADPLHHPNTAANADPLAALAGGIAPPTPAPHGDHLPIGQFGFAPPRAIEAMPAAESVPVAQPAPVVISPASVPVTPTIIAAPVPPPMPVGEKSAAPAAMPHADEDELLAALLRGLGDLRDPPKVLTPELMERIGILLRDAIQGTLQLLLTRQEFKQELRAEVTMIAVQANNPLKFSPSVEVALAHLLGPGIRGFMPASEAMRDAFDDLRAHQFGVMVGTRAALAQLITRFAPDELEKRIAVKSTLDNLFTAHRKAKLWDQFVRFYAEIATEAEEDFHSVFGKAFVKAYEEQMARLESAGQSGRQAEG